jgi:hypothetical protein
MICLMPREILTKNNIFFLQFSSQRHFIYKRSKNKATKNPERYLEKTEVRNPSLMVMITTIQRLINIIIEKTLARQIDNKPITPL